MISPVLFYLMAFVVIFGALMMVSSKNLIYSAFFMLLTFLGVAGIYASMNLSFFAVIQISVYVGAITILIIFGIMLTRHPKGDLNNTNPAGKNVVGAFGVGIGMAVVMSVAIRSLSYIEPAQFDENYIKEIGINLFGNYVLPVELVAVLLMVGLLGAVIIGKEADTK